MSRIAQRFAELKTARRSGLVAFVTGGDPDLATSRRILAALPSAGADIIEIGVRSAPVRIWLRSWDSCGSFASRTIAPPSC